MGRLWLQELYRSIQGETSLVGLPVVVVRLGGCNLRCSWCDTSWAWSRQGAQRLEVPEVVRRVEELAGDRSGGLHVLVTGGEPLLQDGARELVSTLADRGFDVSLETNGSQPLAGVDPRAHVVMDLKAPGSGMADRNRWANLEHLRPEDEVKIVVADRADYDWAVEVVARHGLATRCRVLLSPVHGVLEPSLLARWMIEERFPGRLQLQIHKLIWDEHRRGV